MGGIEPPCKKIFIASLQSVVCFFGLGRACREQTKSYPAGSLCFKRMPRHSSAQFRKFITPGDSHRKSDPPDAGLRQSVCRSEIARLKVRTGNCFHFCFCNYVLARFYEKRHLRLCTLQNILFVDADHPPKICLCFGSHTVGD